MKLVLDIPDGPAAESLAEDMRQAFEFRKSDIGLCSTCGCSNAVWRRGCDCTNVGWCGCADEQAEDSLRDPRSSNSEGTDEDYIDPQPYVPSKVDLDLVRQATSAVCDCERCRRETGDE